MPTSQGTHELLLRIHCQEMPGTRHGNRTEVRLGIQKGDSVMGDVPGDREGVTFEVPLSVKRHAKTGKWVLTGPFVHGKSDDPFIYLSWGERLEGGWDQIGRAKLLLNPLTDDVLNTVLEGERRIEVTLILTGSRGGPACASLKGDSVEWDL